VFAKYEDRLEKCTGATGSVCLLHGSAPNLSPTLYITTYYAEDAIELSPSHLPSSYTHELVARRGDRAGALFIL